MECTAVAAFIYILSSGHKNYGISAKAAPPDGWTRGARLREMGPTSSVGVATLPITHPDETGSGGSKVKMSSRLGPSESWFSPGAIFQTIPYLWLHFLPPHRRFLRMAQLARWAGNLVIYLEWESCNGIVSSRLVHPSDGASGEKVKFE